MPCKKIKSPETSQLCPPFFLLFGPPKRSICNFSGQGWNPSWNCGLCLSYSSAGSLTHCTRWAGDQTGASTETSQIINSCTAVGTPWRGILMKGCLQPACSPRILGSAREGSWLAWASPAESIGASLVTGKVKARPSLDTESSFVTHRKNRSHKDYPIL